MPEPTDDELSMQPVCLKLDAEVDPSKDPTSMSFGPGMSMRFPAGAVLKVTTAGLEIRGHIDIMNSNGQIIATFRDGGSDGPAAGQSSTSTG